MTKKKPATKSSKSAATKSKRSVKAVTKTVKKTAKPAAKTKKNTQTKSVAKKAAVKKPLAKKTAVKKSIKLVKNAGPKIMSKAAAKMVKSTKPATKVISKPIVKATLKSPISATGKPQLVSNQSQPPVSGKPSAIAPKAGSQSFKVGNYVVYPTHGVGKILAEETQKVGEIELRLFVITFEKDKMTLRVPVTRAAAAGLRNISNTTEIEKAVQTLKGRARTSRGMWSRRAQEYEAKINSGSLLSVAEVVRDLHKNVDQSERSYSERMIYESALARLVGEFAAAHKVDSKAATEKLLVVLRQQAA